MIKVIKYQTQVFNTVFNDIHSLFDKFYTTAYAIVEEILYEDDKGTKVGCYNPISNGRLLTYLEQEKVVAEFDTEEAATKYIEHQYELEMEKISKILPRLKKHMDVFFENLNSQSI